MNRPENRKLERVLYAEGQMLCSRDFRDIQGVEAQRRWWHNRSIHQAFGVYQGLRSSSVDRGVIEVTPGVAYDCVGRELLLDCTARVFIPQALMLKEGFLTLLLRYRRADCREATDAELAVCCFAGCYGSPGTIEFIWTSSPRISPSDGIQLGGVQYVKGTPLRFIRFVPAPESRPLARPLVASGFTVPGRTSWQPWIVTSLVTTGPTEVPLSTEIGVLTTIDTSAAGFTAIPQYFAWLQGSIWNAQSLQLVPALLPSISDESINSFTFRLILPPSLPSGTAQLAKRPSSTARARAVTTVSGPTATIVADASTFSVFAQQQQLYVAWLGCQMPAKTPFVPETKVPCCKTFRPEVLYANGR